MNLFAVVEWASRYTIIELDLSTTDDVLQGSVVGDFDTPTRARQVALLLTAEARQEAEVADP